MRGKTHGQALASFGGITRIRFKGSSTNRDLSAIRLPRTFTRTYDHKNRSQSRERVIGYSLLVICKKIAAVTASTKDFVSFAAFVVKDATSRLSPLLRSCEKWPSTRPFSVSKRTRRYKCRKHPCRQTSLQSSQRKWSR